MANDPKIPNRGDQDDQCGQCNPNAQARQTDLTEKGGQTTGGQRRDTPDGNTGSESGQNFGQSTGVGRDQADGQSQPETSSGGSTGPGRSGSQRELDNDTDEANTGLDDPNQTEEDPQGNAGVDGPGRTSGSGGMK